MSGDFLRDSGVQTFGTRLRRLLERLNGNVTDLYRDRLGFEQRWFALGMLLFKRGPLDVGTAAGMLGQSHVAITQVANAMENAALLERRPDDEDRRRKVLVLTSTGKTTLERVEAISLRVEAAAQALIDEAAPEFIQMIDALDDALERRDFASRIADAFDGSLIDDVDTGSAP
ncbi:MarR family transcriptional regulator [uncultured Erythrobacter sp.]|nr:MarR family transcriptional regulator [uncultured Erythrobacter sp.]